MQQHRDTRATMHQPGATDMTSTRLPTMKSNTLPHNGARQGLR